MKKTPLQQELDELWAFYIHRFNYDIVHHILDIGVEGAIYYDITFSDISLFMFYDESKVYQDETSFSWGRVECTSITYEPGTITLTTGTKNKTVAYNIICELWMATLLIKAKKVRINNKEYTLA